ncbi:sensor histidine kinase [Streptomyces deccanensis]|uniref:sensor histidine kinase n=1 Tax=Streptomyces deccanensis TaxID=424188 RepID=UPI001EFC12BA|nr:histidine kinase [Streptomyces deccanensis]ULR52522.1 histidine kinase [Streptomyces deccanensis]
MGGGETGQDGPGARAGRVRRWWDGLPSLLRATPPPPRPSRWAWVADACLAFFLSACTVVATTAQDVGAGPRLPGRVLTPGPGTGASAGPVPPEAPPLPTPPYLTQDLGAPHAWQLLLAALTALPLLVRRRYPLTAFWAVIVTTMVFNQRSGAAEATGYTFLTCVVAAHSAAVHSPYRLRALGSLVAGAALVAVFAEENFPYVTPGVIPFLVLLGVGLGANAIHTWKQRVHALQEQQEAATRLAVEHERARIARELHDVVTHNVSVMVIQAGAARKVMDIAPDRAREALLAVESGGRTAMTELRHVMGLLTMSDEDRPPTTAERARTDARSIPSDSDSGRGTGGGMGWGSGTGAGSGSGKGSAFGAGSASGAGSGSGLARGPGGSGSGSWKGPADDTELAPQPGIGQLPALASRVRASGVPVELIVTGSPVPLPPGADLAAYRVVQEALTNTVKHAAGARVRITVDHSPTALRLEVTDTGGTPTPAAASGTGRGHLGLRERLAVHGGTLDTGPRPTGGYRVRAVIPLTPPGGPEEEAPRSTPPAVTPAAVTRPAGIRPPEERP